MTPFVARLLTYPTLVWSLADTYVLRRSRWWDWIDESVLLGALPFPRHISALRAEGVRAVVNLCREFRGPIEHYRSFGMDYLHLPTTDFFPPSLESILGGVTFIRRHVSAGSKVYIHCKAGHTRSATVALCYLISKGLTPLQAQAHLLAKRPTVTRDLAERDVVRRFAAEWAEYSSPQQY